jgi:hypothetical protein
MRSWKPNPITAKADSAICRFPLMDPWGQPIINHFEDDDASFRDQLARVCGFKDSDLEENRNGRLSTRQMLRLIFVSVAPYFAMLITLTGLVALTVGLYYFGPLIAQRIRLMYFFGKYLIVGIGAVFFGALAFLIKFLLASGRMIHLLRDLSEGKVTSVVGRLTTSQNEEVEDGIPSFVQAFTQVRQSKRSLFSHDAAPVRSKMIMSTKSYAYVVRGEYFEVSYEAWDAMRERDGRPYRVYVTPRSRFLVSMEYANVDPSVRDPFKLEYRDAAQLQSTLRSPHQPNETRWWR